jgi:hypothetical protein
MTDLNPSLAETGEDGWLLRDCFLVCQCSWMGHTLRATLVRWDRDHEPEMHFEFYMYPWGSFWKRLKVAFKYLFCLSSNGGHFDEFMLRDKDIDRLASLIQRYGMVKKLHEVRQDYLQKKAEQAREETNESCGV